MTAGKLRENVVGAGKDDDFEASYSEIRGEGGQQFDWAPVCCLQTVLRTDYFLLGQSLQADFRGRWGWTHLALASMEGGRDSNSSFMAGQACFSSPRLRVPAAGACRACDEEALQRTNAAAQRRTETAGRCTGATEAKAMDLARQILRCSRGGESLTREAQHGRASGGVIYSPT
eukprot:CAMPEP_0117689214 /NCGR_PEP_ID=MMETSP0804-20121206/24343_1 /TAXON_ID=1074897 /ORGANISM="Tetraselmis astigmatica, Strain CCMP880" /LENGTH=173 /DNA_ID=CAMNT_0005501917 /DNA_START=90 /DNA_END=612 /DNA_ORIENTATION=+